MKRWKHPIDDYQYDRSPRNEWIYYADIPIGILTLITLGMLTPHMGGIVWVALPIPFILLSLLRRVFFPLRCPVCNNGLAKDGEYDNKVSVKYYFYSCHTCDYRFYACNIYD